MARDEPPNDRVLYVRSFCSVSSPFRVTSNFQCAVVLRLVVKRNRRYLRAIAAMAQPVQCSGTCYRLPCFSQKKKKRKNGPETFCPEKRSLLPNSADARTFLRTQTITSSERRVIGISVPFSTFENQIELAD